MAARSECATWRDCGVGLASTVIPSAGRAPECATWRDCPRDRCPRAVAGIVSVCATWRGDARVSQIIQASSPRWVRRRGTVELRHLARRAAWDRASGAADGCMPWRASWFAPLGAVGWTTLDCATWRGGAPRRRNAPLGAAGWTAPVAPLGVVGGARRRVAPLGAPRVRGGEKGSNVKRERRDADSGIRSARSCDSAVACPSKATPDVPVWPHVNRQVRMGGDRRPPPPSEEQR